MEKAITSEPTVEESARMQLEIEQSLVEITRLRDSMRRDQAEIEKSRARTRAMLARLQAG